MRFDAFWAFWCLLMTFDAFWCILMPFDAFWCLLTRLLKLFDTFWCFLMSFDTFWSFLMPFWCHLMLFDVLLLDVVLMCFDVIGGLLHIWCLLKPFRYLRYFEVIWDLIGHIIYHFWKQLYFFILCGSQCSKGGRIGVHGAHKVSEGSNGTKLTICAQSRLNLLDSY